MALEGTYEYECMRAELLGVEKPDYEKFVKNKAEREAEEQATREAEALREAHAQQEEFQHVGGKLNELNNILKSTQKKINNFAAPFSKYLKFKIGMSETPKEQTPSKESSTSNPAELQLDPERKYDKEEKVTDLNPRCMRSIDDMIEKFDRAHTSVECQNKQMKRFIK